MTDLEKLAIQSSSKNYAIISFILGIVSLVALEGLTALPICFLAPFGGYSGGY